MASITKVAVIGASGNLGSVVVKALLDASFTVSAITRNESTATFPEGVAVKRADLSSVDSVKDAVAGQDAVISIVASAAAGAQRPIIDGVIAARVPRFLPSEFGIPTRKYRDSKIGALLTSKVANTDYLIELAAANNWFTWTGLSTGLFFDWALKAGGVFFKPAARKATIVDSGDEPFSASTLGFVGQAVVAVLRRPAETANKYLDVAGITTTQNEVVKIAEEVTGAKFDVSHVTGAELVKTADEKLAKHDYSAFIQLLEHHLYSDGAGHALKPEESAHQLLGLQPEDLRASIQKVLE